MVIANPLMPPMLEVGTIPNIQPFTMRENFSQMGLVEGMRAWITNELVPFVNANIDQLSTTWVEQVNKVIADFEAITIGLVSDVNEAVEQIGTSVGDAQAAQAAAEAARDLAALYASQAAEIQDTAISNIAGDDTSATRGVLDGLYVAANVFNTLAEIVDSGRLSDDALNAAFGDAGTAGLFDDIDSATFASARKRFTTRRAGNTDIIATLPFVNIQDFGATPGVAVDQSAAIQAAIDAAGAGGKVVIPPGSYRIEQPLNIPLWVTVEGGNGLIGAGGAGPTELFFVLTGAENAVTLGTYARLSNIRLRGSGTATGTVVGVKMATATLDNVTIAQFATGVFVDAGYYANFTRCSWDRNGIALTLINCYNVNLYGPQMYCSSASGDVPGRGINGAARSLNIYGGSIEGFSQAIVPSNSQMISLFGVYFETKNGANANIVSADSRTNVTVNAFGCMVYLLGTAAFIRLTNSVNCRAIAKGNHFSCNDTSDIAPIGYLLPTDIHAEIGPDNWTEVVKAGNAYASAPGGLPATNAVVSLPTGIVYDGRNVPESGRIQTVTTASSTLTIASDRIVHEINLNGPVLTCNLTGTPADNQEIELSYIQPAGGGMSYAYPTTFRFAGNAAPTDTTGGRRTTVRMRFDSQVGRWHELYRSVAVPN